MTDLTQIGEYPNIIRKIENTGITTLEELIEQNPKQLSKKLDMGKKVVEKLIKQSNNILNQQKLSKQTKEEKLEQLFDEENYNEICKILTDEEKYQDGLTWLENKSNVLLVTSELRLTIKEWYKLYKQGKIVFNHDYQRKQVWNYKREQGLLSTWIEGLPTPNFMVAIRRKEDGSIYYEVIDGQQRFMTIVKYFENRLRLPLTVPSILGGGVTRKNTDSELKDIIEGSTISATVIDNATDIQIKQIYMRLQKGLPLKLGEEVLGETGTIAESIKHHIVKHPFIKRITSKIREYEYAFASYCSFIVLRWIREETIFATLLKENVLEFVEKNEHISSFEEEEFEFQWKRVLDKLELLAEEENVENIPLTDAVALVYAWLIAEQELIEEILDPVFMKTYVQFRTYMEHAKMILKQNNPVLSDEDMYVYPLLAARGGVSDRTTMFTFTTLFIELLYENCGFEDVSERVERLDFHVY